MLWHQPVEFASFSDVGMRRQNNQDSCVAYLAPDEQTFRRRGHLFVVADGMGGHAVGELASKIAVDTIPHTFHKLPQMEARAALTASVQEANTAIHTRGQQNRDFHDMGTTCSALVLGPQGAMIAHVGDSRVYRIRRERIDQLTFDHSLQWELMRQRHCTLDEARKQGPRNVITRCLGPEESVRVDEEGAHPIRSGDTYLLCSDGLTNHVDDAEIGMIAGSLPPEEAGRLLVNLANLRGGTDNVTVVIVRVGKSPAGFRPASETELSPPPERGLEDWLWLFAAWGIALLLALGFLQVVLANPIAGWITVGISVVAGITLAVFWWKHLPQVEETPRNDETRLARPYVTTACKLSTKLLAQLAAFDHVLQKAAVEESWTVDWSQHNGMLDRAMSAMNAGNHTEALRDFGRTIQHLMAAIHQQRKRIDQVVRCGRSIAAEKQKPAGRPE